MNVPKLKSISFYLIMRMKSIPGDVDVIHVHNPKFSGLFKAKNNESKSVLTIHGDYILEAALQYGLLSKPLIWYMNQQVGRADIITCVSPYWSMKRGWVWIPNMIELKAIEKIEPADEKYVLFVGRNDPIKNYPMFKKIAKRKASKK